ncbi:MAG: hypothetical protein FJW27_03290 [Acidimicrobiia bacterium]|nr:hypothetical protein [Acidimicrobiia bacterium]
MDLLLGKPKPAPERIAAVKAWVGELFGLSDGATILVTELACKEPGCPPLETVIAVLDGAGGQWKRSLHKAVSEVTREDVAAIGMLWSAHMAAD